MDLRKTRIKKLTGSCIAAVIGAIIAASVLGASVVYGEGEHAVRLSDPGKAVESVEEGKENVFPFIGTGAAAEAFISSDPGKAVETVEEKSKNGFRFIGTGAAAEAFISSRNKRGIRLTDEIRLCVDSLNELHEGLEEQEKAADVEKAERDSAGEGPDEIKTAEKDAAGKDTDVIQVIGNWELPLCDERALERLLEATEKAGRHLGLVMIDIRTGRGVAVNADREFYGASSIKGPFIISLAAMKPKTLEKQKNAFRAIAVNSDNGSYINLVHVYGRKYYDSWREAVNAEAPLTAGDFANLTAEDLARLWLLNYQYITENRRCGEPMGVLFETPNRSAIQPILGKKYKTQTKGGWIAESIAASADAGIVYAGEHPYIIAVVSDYPSDLKKLEPYVELMERIHTEMADNRLSRKRAREYERQ